MEADILIRIVLVVDKAAYHDNRLFLLAQK